MDERARAALRTTATLATEVPREVAAAWVYAGALAQHATAHGLILPAGSTVDTIKALADAHPALAGLADPATNPMWISTPAHAHLVDELWASHPVTDPPGRFDGGYLLGDLYQTLSGPVGRARALAQTPRFIVDLLLDLTWPDVIRQWRPDEVRIIDPSCGTGHLLVQAWHRAHQAIGDRSRGTDAIGQALAAVAGVDIDPHAAILAAYRLLAVASRRGRIRLDQAPADWKPRVAHADALLDEQEPLLRRNRNHLVLGNPPYVTIKDPDRNTAVRARYRKVASGKYPMSLPFFQLMTELCVPGGWIAQLTANSFMKREFGRRFVTEYLPTLDLRWVIDTSGAYIPGHGTPTVILVHRNQPPEGDTVTVVRGIRGEPRVPADPADGIVWNEIRRTVHDRLAFQRFWSASRAAASQAR
jgi:hypothetical protein